MSKKPSIKLKEITASFKNKVIQQDRYNGNEEIKEVIVPEGVTAIDDRAFQGCINLKKITLPSTLTYIGASVFAGCKNLEEIVIPRKVTSIGYCAFNNCEKLKKVVLPDSLKEIEWGAFSECEVLEEINIPKSVTKIAKKTFNGCKKLDIELPSSVKEIEHHAFNKCYNLTHFPEHVEVFGDCCFNECQSLETATLNKNVKVLPTKMFMSCSRLKEVKCDHKVRIEDECFRSCCSLEVFPEFIENLAPGAFDGCINLKEITIVDPQVGSCCFYECTSIEKINGSEKINYVGNAAFKMCYSLKEVDLSNANHIERSAFEGCSNLEKAILPDHMVQIPERLFYDCRKLKELHIPETVSVIGREAFRYCTKIRRINIPSSTTLIDFAAFAGMESLQRFDVDSNNHVYESPDGIILLSRPTSSLVSYASGCRKKVYNLHKQVVLKENGKEVIYPITTVLPYAFSSARYLQELVVNSCTSDLDVKAFYDCPNLKKLTIVGVEMFSAVGFRFNYTYEEGNQENNKYPFEEIEIKGHVLEILRYGFAEFANVTTLTLPSTPHNYYHIENDAFNDCKKLKKVMIPDNCVSIGDRAFYFGTVVKFPFKYGCTHFDKMCYNSDSGKMYQVIYFNEKQCFILKRSITNPKEVYSTNIWDIEKEIPSNSEYAQNHPDMYVDYLEELKKHNMDIPELRDGYFVSMSVDNKDILFKKFKENKDNFLRLVEESELLDHLDDKSAEVIFRGKNLNNVFEYARIFKEYQINDPCLKSVVLLASLDPEDFEEMCKTDKKLLLSLLENSRIIDTILSTNQTKYFADDNNPRLILRDGKLLEFFKLLHKYGVKDPFIQNNILIANVDNPLVEMLIKYYDNNVKRLLKVSKYLDITGNKLEINADSKQNMNDLLTYMSMMGSFDEDPVTRQRANTFITEKSLIKDDSKQQLYIGGNNIHRIFDSVEPCGYKKDFAQLFMENYQRIIQHEKVVKSGFIGRSYNSFEKIAKHYTSNAGRQRQLKLTVDRLITYLNANKFDNVDKKYEELAGFIGEWFDSNYTWENAVKLVEDAKKAPRNIFTVTTYDEDGKPQYDRDPKHDLVGEIKDGFYFQWLPKQDYNNLVLGKYCNCCAHLEGAGNGIMRASILLDCCQNLVIKNQDGLIIAKSTLYINKDERYGVFNNVEVSYSVNDREREIVYKRFLEGATAFFETYNTNFPNESLTTMTIGSSRNGLNMFLTDENNHEESKIMKGINFGEHAFTKSGYKGDWYSKQRVVVKAPKKEDQQ